MPLFVFLACSLAQSGPNTQMDAVEKNPRTAPIPALSNGFTEWPLEGKMTIKAKGVVVQIAAGSTVGP